MINIIIYQNKILVELVDGGMLLPRDTAITKIKDILCEIYTSSTHYVATINKPDSLPNNLVNLQFIGIRQVINYLDSSLIQDIIYYQQLNNYYSTHQYCGTCGNRNIRRKINKFVYCNTCESENYPHIAPCIIVRIHKDDSILMARGVNSPHNYWGLIAGFIEIGESLESGVKREVQEEVGIEIDNICYWGSQPWPFPNNSLMIGFTANYKSGIVTPDKYEIEEAGFYTINNMPKCVSPTSFSIANKMIKEFRE